MAAEGVCSCGCFTRSTLQYCVGPTVLMVVTAHTLCWLAAVFRHALSEFSLKTVQTVALLLCLAGTHEATTYHCANQVDAWWSGKGPGVMVSPLVAVAAASVFCATDCLSAVAVQRQRNRRKDDA